MRKLLLFAAIALLQITAFSQNPKREVRAAWLTTHSGLDWPNNTTNQTLQKDRLISILESHKALGINTIYFQVRSLSDAMYPSTLVPWAQLLTGTYNGVPANNFNPLLFAIDEAHKRGMELHAWLNPYRVATTLTSYNNLPASHPAKQPGIDILTSGGIHYLDPGLSAVTNHIKAIVEEIVVNYDVDGIHFDDYFYQGSVANQDDATLTAEPRGFTLAQKEDWRRNNITLMARTINDAIKAKKSWVKFGISPSGIYRNSTNPAIGSNTGGSQHYSVQYIDSKYIMEQDIIDYLIPQVYWYIGQGAANYNIVTPWWNTITTNRQIYIGIAAYKVDENQVGWVNNPNEINNQIDIIRNLSNLKGAAFFRSLNMINDPQGIRTSLVNNRYNTPAIIPAMTWIDNVAPAEPSSLTSTLAAGKTKLDWTAPASTTDELQKVVRYAVYRSTSPTIDYSNSANLIAILPSTAITYTDNAVTPGSGTSYYYAVTSLDRISNESVSSNVVPDAITLPVKLINFAAKKDGNRVKIEWSTASELNSDYFLIEKAGIDGVFNYLAKQNSAAQNTSTIQNYATWDYNPFNGINYYRLTQFDKDGTASKPEFTSLNFNELIIVNATAFPNPTQRDINFNLENFNGKSIKTRLINLFGQVIHEEEFDTQSGANKYQLGLKTELPKGQYILSLSDNSFKKNIKLVVL
ncbi:MAG: T9SS type A sorting domain-containing protein [Flavobacteriales bacterium]|nr:MAG: T9SS type A sorting domain-containing protein [Flavobacteriales bacterium]